MPAISATSRSSPTARSAVVARKDASRPRRPAPRSRITGRPPAEASPEVRARTGRLVGRAIASVANLLDLQLAVVSGSVALGYGDAFFAAAQAEIDARRRLDFSRGTRVVPGALRDDGPLVGAAAVALFG